MHLIDTVYLAQSARISNFQLSIFPACRQAGINDQCFNFQVGSLRTRVWKFSHWKFSENCKLGLENSCPTDKSPQLR